MHLSLILETVPGENCCICGGTTNVVQLSLFTKATNGMLGPFCLRCMEGKELKTELEGPDLEDEGKHKTFRAQKKRSREQELEIAEELGAKMQKGSGSISGSKGDVRKKGEVRVEAKYTEAASYSLRLEDLHKILSECHGTERPVFVVDFVEKTTKRLTDRYAIVPFYDLKELLDAAHKNR